ncbi:polyketide synthase [Teratosphaeria nubilosa]|uniref:Polyketide synthase n=1 Tax=Teratosphaeria nubilosa TaxID=161662 RepID=A0A6G1LL96_9PEZI|nr:polyketide synthase [Teratosphaeria nubilosa]
MASEETIEKALEIIGEAISTEPSDFHDHETWRFLGLGDLSAAATASDIKSQLGIDLSGEVFKKYPTVGAFKAYLRGDEEIQANGTSTPLPEPDDPWEGVPKPKVPLSAILQGDPQTSSINVFLFPDGSGAGMAYGTLPSIGNHICIIALNSPFLRQAEDLTCSIERMARLWVDEVQKIQPKGPYTIGGWSAGGYYSTEIVKLLAERGQKTERIILIDSPCRLEFEALPAQVVQELTKAGLMGARGTKKAPEWLVQHFTSTVISVEKYMPTPLRREDVPAQVNFIWVREGLVKSVQESGLNVDMNVKVTRFLLEPRPQLKTVGWEKIFPGAKYNFDYMSGNHFQITQPPYSDDLGRLLRKIISQRL